MNFLIDANLPRYVGDIFRERGHQVIHTLDLSAGNAATDSAILKYADEQNCIIATKDSDSQHHFG